MTMVPVKFRLVILAGEDIAPGTLYSTKFNVPLYPVVWDRIGLERTAMLRAYRRRNGLDRYLAW